MRYILFVIIIVSLVKCGSADNKQVASEPAKKTKYKKLLAKFKDISFDTLHVYAALEDTGKYKGKVVDSIDAVLFPKEIADGYSVEEPGIFACYQFPIDKRRIGLIARTPSEYVPSSMKLFIYDKQKDTITGYIELAEEFGDAGDVMIKNAWLFKNKEKKWTSFIWVQESHDNSVENEKDTTMEISDDYYLIDISKNKPDTISDNKDKLVRMFKSVIGK